MFVMNLHCIIDTDLVIEGQIIELLYFHITICNFGGTMQMDLICGFTFNDIVIIISVGEWGLPGTQVFKKMTIQRDDHLYYFSALDVLHLFELMY